MGDNFAITIQIEQKKHMNGMYSIISFIQTVHRIDRQAARQPSQLYI